MTAQCVSAVPIRYSHGQEARLDVGLSTAISSKRTRRGVCDRGGRTVLGQGRVKVPERDGVCNPRDTARAERESTRALSQAMGRIRPAVVVAWCLDKEESA